ncbi:MAG TPA: FimV/HubP family polar landmark protein [Cellvibrio sp.]|nr:FimV/HubP family polar landmark protein [Cellvibrio sp.]
MQLRKLVLACGFASFALSNYASALGLGDVKLNSTLNQPLNAEIKLLDTRDLSAEQILINLASAADFERNGVDRTHFYTEFQFEVDLKRAGGPIVRVTTRNPVREPYLNFLLEARWTSGRLLREYTLLMDLPTFDTTAPQAVQAPVADKPKVSSTTRPRNVPVAPVSEAPAFSDTEAAVSEENKAKKKSRVSDGNYGPISGKDTLWDIAKEVRPDTSVSVHQTMLALQRLNPDAFIRGNINLLKKGQVLRVPSVEEAAAVSRTEAINQVAAQNNRWSSPTLAPDTVLEAQVDASRSTGSPRKKTETVSGRVKLEAPSTGENANNGQGSGTDKSGGKGLDAELAATQEELDKAKSENTELTSRVQDLEEQIKTMQRLVDASNEKMRGMQLNAVKQAENKTAANQPAESIAAPVPEASVPAPAAEPVAEVATSSSAEAVAVPPPAASAAAASSVAKKNSPPKPQPQAEKSLAEHFSDNLLWVLLAAAGLTGVGATAFFAHKRKKEEEEEAGKHFSEAAPFYIPDPSFEHLNQPQYEAGPQVEAEEIVGEDDHKTVIAETDDVVSEAGIYISLGQYHQAEDMLRNALETGTASGDIYLKLLEVYSHTQNINEFDKYYAALWPMATPVELNRASELRSTIAGADSFQGASVANDDTVIRNNFNDDTVIRNNFNQAVPADDNIDVSARRYDLDFGNASLASHNPSVSDDEFVLAFAEDNKSHPEAEDLSDISLALDSLEDSTGPAPAAVATLEEDAHGAVEEEISFNFSDLDLGEMDFNEKNPAEMALPDVDHADDFNLEMNVDDVDLAALDREMASLDADPTFLDAIEVNSVVEIGDEDVLSSRELEDFDALFAGDAEAPVAETAADQPVAEADTFTLDLDDDLSLPQEGGGELNAPTFAVNEELHEELPLESVAETVPAQDSLPETEQALPWQENAVTEQVDDAEPEITLAADDYDDAGDESADSILEQLDFSEDDEEPATEIADLSLEDDVSLADLDAELQDLSAGQAENLSLADAQLAEVGDENALEDDVFAEALSDFSAESLNAEAEAEALAESDIDSELDFMVDADEAATKLDLARAYLDMGDNEGARDILAEVAQEGTQQQREEAVSLLSRIDA